MYVRALGVFPMHPFMSECGVRSASSTFLWDEVRACVCVRAAVGGYVLPHDGQPHATTSFTESTRLQLERTYAVKLAVTLVTTGVERRV